MARDQNPDRRALDDRRDELLRRRRRGEVLVVVDHHPTAIRPVAEILGEHLAQQRRLALGIGSDREPLEQATSGSVHHDAARLGEPPRGHRDVRRRRSRAEPADRAVVARSPLLRKERLSVADAADERAHACVRPFERADEPGALDDPAPADLRLPWPVCHRVGHEPTPGTSSREVRPRPAWAGRGRLPSAAPWGVEPDEERDVRVLPGEQSVRRRYLPAARDAQLQAESIAVSLRRPRGDSQRVSHLVVRAPGRDERHDLALPVGQRSLGCDGRSRHVAILPSLDRVIHSSRGVSPGVIGEERPTTPSREPGSP